VVLGETTWVWPWSVSLSAYVCKLDVVLGETTWVWPGSVSQSAYEMLAFDVDIISFAWMN